MNGISLQINVSSMDELRNLLDSLGQPVVNIAPTNGTTTGQAPAVPETSHTSLSQPPTTAPTAPAEAQTAPVITASPEYTFDQLANAAALFTTASQQNYEAGMRLLAKYGATMLTDLPKEQYGNFATELRQLGAQI